MQPRQTRATAAPISSDSPRRRLNRNRSWKRDAITFGSQRVAIVLGSVVSGTRSAAVPGYNRAMASYEKRTWWTHHGLTERLTSEPFLEAAVTSAFLIAAADGHAS